MLTLTTIKKWWQQYPNCDELEAKLLQHRFRVIGIGAYKVVYGKPRYPYVIKLGYVEDYELRSHPGYLAPVWGRDSARKRGWGIMVQLRVRRTNNAKHFNYLNDSFDWNDWGERNCGLLKGKPFIIDL